MKKLITSIILALFITNIAQAQIDFSKFIDKKSAKKANKEWDCSTGNCKDGFGVLSVTSDNRGSYYIFAGNFKDKQLNGEAIILYKRNKYGFNKAFDVKAYFERRGNFIDNNFFGNVFEFEPIFYGTFKNNKLIEGEYKCYGYNFNEASIGIDYRFTSLILDRIRNNVVSRFLYHYKGSFLQDENGKPTHSLKNDTDFINIITPFNRPQDEKSKNNIPYRNIVITKSSGAEYLVKYLDKNNQLVSQENIADDKLNSRDVFKLALERDKKPEPTAEEKAEMERKRIARRKAESSCKVFGKWVEIGKLHEHTGSLVCTKNGLVPFFWEHPLTKEWENTIRHYKNNYNGSNGRYITFPQIPTIYPGRISIVSKAEDVEHNYGGKVFVVEMNEPFDKNYYELCSWCGGSGKFFIADDNPNIMQRTRGWYLAYDYSKSWKSKSGSVLLENKNKSAKLKHFSSSHITKKIGLGWKETLTEGHNVLPCIHCKGMGLTLK